MRYLIQGQCQLALFDDSQSLFTAAVAPSCKRCSRRAAATTVIASGGLRYLEPDSWLRTASGVLLWLSIPVGVVLACLVHRFSIIEGCAGDVGYADLESDHEEKLVA